MINQMFNEHRQYLIGKHRERQDRFEKKAIEEENRKKEKKYDFEMKYSEKIRRAEKAITEIKDAVVRKKNENL